MNPLGSNLHTLFANSLFWVFDFGDRVDMKADSRWHYFFLSLKLRKDNQ